MALPTAARRWLERAVPSGTATPSRVVVKQRGKMEANARWLKFKATGTYEASPLTFSWRARMGMLPGLWVVAEDGHADGEGWGGARLWGFKSMGERRGPEVLATQLVRHIGELVWLPDAAQADPALFWTEADGDAFEIRSDAGGVEVVVRFDVDGQGDVIRTSSPARPYDVPEGFATAPWAIEFGDHREFDGVRTPSRFAARFDFEDGPWEYLRGEVTGIERTFASD